MTSVRAVFDEYLLAGSTAAARDISLQTIRRGTDALGSHTTADGCGFLEFLGEPPDKLWDPVPLD